VTPETARFLQNAEKHLERGHTMLGVHLNDDAARARISLLSTLRKLLFSSAAAG
jgi:hypothetical protein